MKSLLGVALVAGSLAWDVDTTQRMHKIEPVTTTNWLDTESVVEPVPEPTPVEDVTPIAVEPPRITCDDCSIQEQMALNAFQDRGINDRFALAALMGNIRQESRFTADICEGGARVPYERCHRGGYGLIQWTTTGRYDGLGRYSRLNECNPSTTECQLGYLFTEYQWKSVEPYLLRGGNSIEWYMQHTYKWLGWGIHGARTDYAYDYTRRFSPHP